MGNHAAILTDYNRPLMEKLKKFLEDIGYRGFANFDIKLDSRDGEFKLFEINVRQGRSNYYLTASGCNPARLIVEDKLLGRSGECVFCEEKAYWSYLPLKLVLRYATVSEREQIFRCRAEGKAFFVDALSSRYIFQSAARVLCSYTGAPSDKEIRSAITRSRAWSAIINNVFAASDPPNGLELSDSDIGTPLRCKSGCITFFYLT